MQHSKNMTGFTYLVDKNLHDRSATNVNIWYEKTERAFSFDTLLQFINHTKNMAINLWARLIVRYVNAVCLEDNLAYNYTVVTLYGH